MSTYLEIRRQQSCTQFKLHASKVTEEREFGIFFVRSVGVKGGSVAEWLACWTQAQKGPGSNRSRDAVE